MRLARSRAQTDATTNAAIFAALALTLFATSAAVVRGWITLEVLILFLGALGRLTNLLRTGTRSYGEIQEAMPAAERVFAVLDRPSLIADKPDARDCPVPRERIRLENVAFHYATDAEDVLRGITMDIPVGKTVGLVGESGVGKSTILDLIPRFRDATGGRITIDGIDIRDLKHASLVKRFAIVQQDSFLFNDTVYNNIRYGRPDASREEIEQAAKRAHIHDAILGLEGGKGYDTVVGDRGERLSGGQRQRVAIARALLRDAPVLLLDEPTSALDADSERHVQAALAELMRGRTSIVVAHRLATIQHADLIYVLGRTAGNVVESGNHRDLVAKDGEYARLVRMQQLA
jgi:ABC-type multidrug transport system fused ATPase/permease subunit